MKSNYYKGDLDPDQDINTNGLSDSRLMRDSAIDDSGSHDNLAENVDRMLKLFTIPSETLPCPEKRQANEILMEQMSKNESINGSNKVSLNFNNLVACILLIIANAFVL